MGPSDNTVFKYHPDTKEYLLKEYNVDTTEKFDEVVNVLMDWINKQKHFVKKDFPKDYLKKLFLCNKGSVERVKMRLDKLCTLRTLSPKMFRDYDFNTDYQEIDEVIDTFMPALTPNHERVYIFKISSDDINEHFFYNYFRYYTVLVEYMVAHDYFERMIVVLDFTNVNLASIIPKLKPAYLQEALTLKMDGLGLRLKAIHVITPSTLINIIVGMIKQLMSQKMGSRIQMHTSIDTLKDFLPLESLPQEYGGKDKSLKELHDIMVKEVSTSDHMKYLKHMNEFRTNEDLRSKDKFNEQCIGLPGSFRTLAVD